MRIGLDSRDLKILSVLQRDGRIKKSALAAEINLSPAACWERLTRLEQAGVISGYRAEVALDRIARVSLFVVQIELEQHRAADFQKFEAAVARLPEVTRCLAVGGGVDYFLEVMAPDVDSYQHLIQHLLESEIGVKRYFTYVVTKNVKSSPPPVRDLVRAAEETPD
ncbi:MAG: Lrp/AsnC family transcriptional regulator [Alphaproteobacteria bacterium]|nr:Lrp/AsnC family transcriptional regulator [Alphaproteobacteria bacterium]MDX5370624.1 Lrp/AsnC family transcriptional regulator [Alphaproteobacteria bacterium]MDX5465069.1 Lrp/AsnC family transcriptional regulator [Alphaproteobacteria bacterium]